MTTSTTRSRPTWLHFAIGYVPCIIRLPWSPPVTHYEPAFIVRWNLHLSQWHVPVQAVFSVLSVNKIEHKTDIATIELKLVTIRATA